MTFLCSFVSARLVLVFSFIASTGGVLALNHLLADAEHIVTQNTLPKQGWTSQPDGRGTLDILWSCSITMFLCSWSMLCMNMPGPKETRKQILWRKLSLTALGILCPELLFELALGQWLAARKAVRDFNSLNCNDNRKTDPWYKFSWVKHIENGLKSTEKTAEGQWTMKTAFFVDMGGFILHTQDQRSFPIDAKQLHYLVAKGHLQMPSLDHRVIQDKNKADGLLRAITVCQILWFLINTIGRWAQDLVVTTAELTTVSFILCSLGTAFCWWHKPVDAGVAEVIHSNINISGILWAEGHSLHTWRRTPLDFVNRKEWWWSKSWANFVNILKYMRLTFGSSTRPIDRFEDTLQKEIPKGWIFVCMALTAACFSVFLVGWDYSFPTRTEQILWRVASVTMMSMCVALTTVSQLAGLYSDSKLQKTINSPRFASWTSRTDPQTESGRRVQESKKGVALLKKVDNAFNRVRNNSFDKDPQLYVPLRIIVPLYLIGVSYCHARAYILIADIIELRALPASAYASVDWQRFVPHLG